MGDAAPASVALWRAALPTSTGKNCLQNGLLPVELRQADAGAFEARVLGADGAAPFTSICRPNRHQRPGRPGYRIRHGRADRMRLIEGLDDIGLTLKHAKEIAAWERRMGGEQPWLQTTSDSRRDLPLPRKSGRGEGRKNGVKLNVRRNCANSCEPGSLSCPAPMTLCPPASSRRRASRRGGRRLCGGRSMLAHPDTGQSNMRDYADHYGAHLRRHRAAGLCGAIPALAGVTMPPDGARLRGGRRRGIFHQRPDVS